METSEDEFGTPGAATVEEVRVSGAAVSKHISRERSTPPLPAPKKCYVCPSFRDLCMLTFSGKRR